MPRALVIGGGAVGLGSAIRLAERGWAVTVFDDDDTRRAASWGNAGHIAVEQIEPLASFATVRSLRTRRFAAGGPVDLPLRSIRHWLPFGTRLIAAATPSRFAAGKQALAMLLADAMPAWRRLAEAIGDPMLVRDDGHLVVWERSGSAAAGRAAWFGADIGTASIRDAGQADRAWIETLSSAAIAGAVRFDGSGQIADLGRLADALEATLLRLDGVIVRRKAVVENAGGVATVCGIEAPLVVVAAGIGSAVPMAALGHRVPMIAERGYHIRGAVSGAAESMAGPPVVFEDRSTIVTRYGDRMQAAGFVEFGAATDPADPRKWERLENHARELGLPMREPFDRWMGSRPTLPDYLPAIGRSRRARNVVYAFGHQHLGLTLAPITAEIVATLAGGDDPRASPFDIERFGSWRKTAGRSNGRSADRHSTSG